MVVHDAKNSVNVTKIESPENKVTLKEAIIANLIIGPIALGLYFGIYYGIHISNPIYILNNMYYFPYLLSFCCFFVLPVLYLIIFRIITKKKTRLFISTKKMPISHGACRFNNCSKVRMLQSLPSLDARSVPSGICWN